MDVHRGYSLVLVRLGHTVESDSDEYLWQVYRPDGKLMGERWTRKAAVEWVDSLLDYSDTDRISGTRVDDDS